jgi:hypothetical protein
MRTSKPIAVWYSRHAAILVLLVLLLGSSMVNAQIITLGEAVDNTALIWTTGGDAEWFGQTSDFYFDGDAARSGNVSSFQQSWIETTVTGPGVLSFYWKVSSSSGSQDLKFYIDGSSRASFFADAQWQLKAYVVPSGSHTIRWIYAPFIPVGNVAGFLDKVVFTSDPVIILESPNGGESWRHRDAYTIRWASNEGAGSGVKIELYKGESSKYTISNSTDNDGDYSWFVPAWIEPAADYRIKITSTSNPAVYGFSDDHFSINAWEQSSFGGLLVLDGMNDYALADDHPELDVGDEVGESLTIEAWVNIRGNGSMSDSLYLSKLQSYRLVLRRYSTYDYPSGTYGCFGVSFTPPSDSISGFEVCKRPAYTLGWHHVTAVFSKDTSQVRLYMDGTAFSDPVSWSALNNSTEGLKIGGELSAGVDEVRISAVARYTGSTYPTPTSPFTCDAYTRALWHFDEFEGATIFHDSCGADNFLVGYNGAHTEGVHVHRIHLPLILK